MPMLCWAPDGEWLAFGEKASEDAPARIVRLSLATLEKRPLTSPPPDSLGDLQPQVSPDGRLLAFVRSGTRLGGNQDVWIQPVSGGVARPLTSGQYGMVGAPDWTPDGTEIVFSYGDHGPVRLARVPLAGGAPQPIVGVGENAAVASVRGNQMVFVQNTTSVVDTWRLPRPGAARSTDRPEKLLASGALTAYSPDGRKIAFQSSRDGTDNIWLSNADGSHPVQLTTVEERVGHAPMVSGRAPARVRLDRGREQGPLCRRYGRRHTQAADPGALGGRTRDMVARRPVDLLRTRIAPAAPRSGRSRPTEVRRSR